MSPQAFGDVSGRAGRVDPSPVRRPDPPAPGDRHDRSTAPHHGWRPCAIMAGLSLLQGLLLWLLWHASADQTWPTTVPVAAFPLWTVALVWLLCLTASLPGGTFLTAQLLRSRFLRHLPIAFGGLSKRRVPDDQFLSWTEPLRRDRKVRRDLEKYLRRVPKRTQLLEWAEQQCAFKGHVLVVWAREDRLMPPEHAERLADCFEYTEFVWVDDSSTLIPIDQPETLTAHLERFLERYAL